MKKFAEQEISIEEHVTNLLAEKHSEVVHLINDNAQEIWGEFDGVAIWISDARDEMEFKLISDDWAELEDMVDMDPREFAVKYVRRLRA